MKRMQLVVVVRSSFSLAATAGEPQDRTSLAKDVLQEINTTWKAAVEVDGAAPDFPVVRLSFSNCRAEEVTDEGLRHLRDLPGTRELTLIRVPVTAEGVGTLKTLPH